MSGKGLLKRISGCLKYAAISVPVLFMAAGVGMFTGAMVESANNTKTLKGYYASAPVEQVIQAELDELDQSVANGEFTFTEAGDKYNEIKSDDHRKEVADEVYKEDVGYQNAIYTMGKDYGLAIGGMGAVVVGMVSTIYWYMGSENIKDKLTSDAYCDFSYARVLDENKKRKNEVEPELE